VTGYFIYRNGSQLNAAPLTVTKYLAERPRGKDVYEFTVAAVDQAGNLSLPSNTAVSANGNIKDHSEAQSDDGDSTFTLYPNPSRSGFRVNIASHLAEDGPVTIVIYNRAGFIIQSINDLKNGLYQREIDLSGLSPGTYVVRITGRRFSEAKNLIVE
jgi:hypothetical protein